MVNSRYLRSGLLLIDTLLCAAIILRVKYTEIDWKAYMQQVEQYLVGERDYALIKGQTGPLVYPGLHVHLYSALYYITQKGRSIVTAQVIFAGIYLTTVAITMATYRRVKAPSYAFPLLILSKRLHSIYLLRLFNDGISTLLSSASTYCYVRKHYYAGTILFSLSLGIKMNALLYLPAIVLILIQGTGVRPALRHGLLMIQIQALLGLPFILHHPAAYFQRAFDLSRVFAYEWTVNWRFLSEPTFLSPRFAGLLLAGHGAVLLVFAATRWTRPSRQSLLHLTGTSLRTSLGSVLFPTAVNDRPMAEPTPDFILTTLSCSALIGILFARSAHYQFYSWFALSVPHLLSKTGLPVALQVVLWVAQEWAWNVFPSTPWSSAVVVAVPAVTLVAVWIGTAKDVVGVVVTEESHEARAKVARRAKQSKQVKSRGNAA